MSRVFRLVCYFLTLLQIFFEIQWKGRGVYHYKWYHSASTNLVLGQLERNLLMWTGAGKLSCFPALIQLSSSHLPAL
eukprot:scaffold281648_cov14-Tisochrysis_lutea.AAC.1